MDAMERNDSGATVRHLVEQRLVVRASRVERLPRALSTGLPALDRFLPHGGLLPGGLTEWVGDGVHLLAGWPLAFHGKRGKVVYVGMRGCVHPEWVGALGGGVDGYFAAQWHQPQELAWLTEQVIGSGLFELVVIGGANPDSGAPWFDEVMWRRWMGASKRHGTAVLVLVRPHESLGNMARPCWGRLHVRVREEGIGISLRLEKCAGSAPGAVFELGVAELRPVDEVAGGVEVGR